MIKKLKLGSKLWLMILPAILGLLVVGGVGVISASTINTNSIESLYDNLYTNSMLLLNADRDFYQTYTSEQEMIYDRVNMTEAELNALYEEYTSNAKQTFDGVIAALDNVRDNEDLYSNYLHPEHEVSLQQLEESYIRYYEQWEKAYLPLTNQGDYNTQKRYFNQARIQIDMMTENYGLYADDLIIEQNK